MSSALLFRSATRSATALSSRKATLSFGVRPNLASSNYSRGATCFFSSDSHDDFAPKRKAVSGEDEAMNIIKSHVEENRVMLYMKGNPAAPQCGFSATTVKILKAEGVDFSSVNVLDYPSIRESVKKYSSWPTIPQLYVNGEFIGGCDIITQMHESGELKDALKEQ